MRFLLDEINERIEFLSRIVNEKEGAVAGAPEGKLRIRTRKGGLSYYMSQADNHNGIYLPEGNRQLITSLAQKSYDMKALAAARAELKALERVRDFYGKNGVAEDCYGKLSPMRQELVEPVVMTDEQYIEYWKEKHPPREEGLPDTAYETMKGDMVRSRAEILISDRIFAKGHVYQYEAPLWVDGILFHPDFSILNLRRRRTIFWEHLGLLDQPQYLESSVKKLNIYARNGIRLGDNLIITFETSEQPFNTAQIDPLIDLFIA